MAGLLLMSFLRKSDIQNFWIQNDTLSNRTFHSKFLSAYTFRPTFPCWSGHLHTVTQRCCTDIHRQGQNRIQKATILENTSLANFIWSRPDDKWSDFFANCHLINSSGWPPHHTIQFSYGLFIWGHQWEKVSIVDNVRLSITPREFVTSIVSRASIVLSMIIIPLLVIH